MGGADPSTARRGILEAAAHLRAGGLLVHPTSTLYGIGGRCTAEIDGLLAAIKGRPAGGRFVRLAADVAAAKALLPAGSWDGRAESLSRAFWPGSLTLVLEDGSPTGVAVRVDPEPFVRAVVTAFGEPISSTSVNRTGEPPAVEVAAVRRWLDALEDPGCPVTFLNAGRRLAGVPSTILSLRERPARLVRAGAVPRASLAECLEEEVVS